MCAKYLAEVVILCDFEECGRLQELQIPPPVIKLRVLLVL